MGGQLLRMESLMCLVFLISASLRRRYTYLQQFLFDPREIGGVACSLTF